MKKTFLALIATSILFSFRCALYAGVYFENTKTDLRYSVYTPESVKGENIVTLRFSKNDFSEGIAEQVYPIFISSEDVTYINFEEFVASVIASNSDNSLFTIMYNTQNREKGFSIRATQKSSSVSTLQVTLSNAKKVYLKIYVGPVTDANSVVNFLNYEPDKKKIENEQFFIRKNSALKTKILYDIFSKGSLLYPIHLKKQIQESTLELVNLNVVDTTYYFMLKFSGKNSLALNFNEISLEITNLETNLFSTTKPKQISYKVNDIILKTIADQKQVAFLIFHLPKTISYFRFQLWVAPKMMFDHKVSLELVDHGSNLGPLKNSVL